MILKAKNLAKAFYFPKKVEVLADISLTIAPKESIAIMGKSGEGKTTLLHLLGALEFPDRGEIEIEGELLTRSNAARLRSQSIGFIFQSYNLLEDFTALENVLMPAKIARAFKSIEEGIELLKLVHLEHRAHFPVKLLSGGEKQRVAIARALCNDPKIILADEPSGNLDAFHREELSSLLFSLLEKKGKSLILATHDPDLAAKCSKHLLLQGGFLSS